MATPAGSLLYHPNSEGHHIFNLNLALIIVSTTLISLRLFVRKVIVKALGWDDLMAVVAWVGQDRPLGATPLLTQPLDALCDTLRS